MKKILYVEDDPTLATVTVRALRARSFTVHHFASVAEVRRESKPEQSDWALLDLRLEDGSSMELIDWLLNENPALQIVILTAYASIATAVQAIKNGAVNYLSKPASIDQIIHAFAEATDPPESFNATGIDNMLTLRRMEWEHIQQALMENNGNISATARQLKMHRRTLQRKLTKKPTTD